jgi:D-sedoheptulose 7-phosphate isomerase
MCDAMHFAEELSGRFREDRKALPAISISDPSHISCVANDYGYDAVYARMIDGIGEKGDVLTAFTTSGNGCAIPIALRSIGFTIAIVSFAASFVHKTSKVFAKQDTLRAT